MQHVPQSALIIILIFLVFISAFFSCSEIGMMSLNRYRLRHLAKKKHRKAMRVEALLTKPDRLLGVILIGNTIANIIASAIATILGQRLYGDPGVAIATALLTLVILVVSEMAPKTIAALYPQKVAFFVSLILKGLLTLFSPVVWVLNKMANALVRLFGVDPSNTDRVHLTQEELRTVVHESGNLVSSKHKSMLTSILDLKNITVDDIMVPRTEIVGIDLLDEWDAILERLETAQHTRLPLFEGGVEHVIGMIHIRSILNLLVEKKLDKKHLRELAETPYFVLEGTGLYEQLLHFQREKKRSCFIVDEYGDLQGLVTLEDILEEIVGEFTTDMAAMIKEVREEKGGSFVVDAGANIRELNRVMQWTLPTEGPSKTLNGLITETLGVIPPPNSSLKLADYVIEILQVKDNMVKTVRISLWDSETDSDVTDE